MASPNVLGFMGLIVLTGATLHLLMYTSSPPEESIKCHWSSSCPNKEFVQSLMARAAPDGTIILALVDTAFVDMAINLFLTSFKPFGIDNYLFVGASANACHILHNHSLPCFTYTEDKAESQASVYMSKDFLRKMNIRTDMILDALNVGFTVLHTDLDVVFVKNPMPVLADTAGDLVSLWDDFVHNAGFVLVRPTWYGKKIYENTKQITENFPKIDDQKALNQAISRLKNHYSTQSFKTKALSGKQFLCGLNYFEKGNRLFPIPKPCKECIVVHNNWIVSKEAKVYRFREHFMWAVDTDQYYSSTSRRYLLYTNVVNLKKEDKNRRFEAEALRSALAMGELLNRTVILPQFHCTKTGGKICPLNSLFKITAFDSQFGDHYREHSFLDNPMVPKPVVDSQSPVLFVASQEASKTLLSHNITVENSVIQVHPDNAYNVTSDEIVSWFSGQPESVLRLHSLGGIHIVFSDPAAHSVFQNKVDLGFKKGSYRQL